MNKYILIVDDEPHFRFAVSVALKRAGFRVSEAGNGAEALDVLEDAEEKGEVVNLMLLDIQMPLMNGLELLDEMKARGIGVPVFAVSGFGDMGLAVELVEKGCREFLDKPFDLHDLIDKIDRVLEQERIVENKGRL